MSYAIHRLLEFRVCSSDLLAPDNSYVVSLYRAPIRQSATRDIGRGNCDNRQRGRRNTGNADSAHNAFLKIGRAAWRIRWGRYPLRKQKGNRDDVNGTINT